MPHRRLVTPESFHATLQPCHRNLRSTDGGVDRAVSHPHDSWPPVLQTVLNHRAAASGELDSWLAMQTLIAVVPTSGGRRPAIDIRRGRQ